MPRILTVSRVPKGEIGEAIHRFALHAAVRRGQDALGGRRDAYPTRDKLVLDRRLRRLARDGPLADFLRPGPVSSPRARCPRRQARRLPYPRQIGA